MHFGGKGYSRVRSRPLFQNLILEYCNEVEIAYGFFVRVRGLNFGGHRGGRKKYSGSHFFLIQRKYARRAYFSYHTTNWYLMRKIQQQIYMYSTFSKSMSICLECRHPYYLDRTSFLSKIEILKICQV